MNQAPKNKAFVKTTVLRNQAKSIEIALSNAVEDSESDEKHQSAEIKEDVFHIRALVEINTILLKKIQENQILIQHIASKI